MVRNVKTAMMLMLALMVTFLSASVASAADPVTTELYDVQGRVVGSATLSPMDDGGTEVVVKVSGMQTVGGDRGLAITERGFCSDDGDYSSAGDDAQSLPPVQFFSNGGADYKVVVDDVNLDALADADGSALVIYADVDSDERIICGLIHEDTGEAPADDSGDETPAEETPADEAPADDSDDEAPAEETPADDSSDDGPVSSDDPEYTLLDALNQGNGMILRDVQGRDVGFGLMYEIPGGDTVVNFFLEGMEATGGDHRIALTETGTCEAPDFASAGDEATVLPNVQFYSSGAADYLHVQDDVDLASLGDDDGSAVVIYADAGDDPGDRIVCGEITSAETALDYLGLTVEEFVFLTIILSGG